ncbi:MAG: site-2 protease family protein [Aphanizomenon flos-aquae CP01]|nr:site-2 protease family protein [Aphanizomenon flos-aquae CP01]
MLLTFLSILGAIGILLVIVVVHEAGHFFAARYFGMQTPVVGLGLPFFGPTWKIGKIQDVEFRLHPLLLGAYVAIPEMDDESSAEDFDIQLDKPKKIFPAWQRMIVSFAGPGSNILFALFLAFVAVIFLGVPQSANEGFYITQVSDSASKEVKANLKSGDKILEIDSTVVKSSEQFREIIQTKPNQIVSLKIQRLLSSPNQESPISYCVIENLKTDSQGFLRISLSDEVKMGPVQGTPVISHTKWAWKYFSNWFGLCTKGLVALLTAPFHRTADSPKLSDVHGVIMVTNVIAKFLKQSASSAIEWGAILSIDIGIINLLPILPLDGGHILFQGGEIASGGRKLIKLREYVAQAGLFLILGLIGLVIFNDLRSLIFPAS